MIASNIATPKIPTIEERPAPEKVSDQIERWLASDGDKTLGGLIDMFEEKSFALIFILLLGVPALPLPTGGATHVFELIAMLVALQLVAGRDKIWLPQRWRKVELGTGGRRTRFITGLMKTIRWIERLSRPRLRFLFGGCPVRRGTSAAGLLSELSQAGQAATSGADVSMTTWRAMSRSTATASAGSFG
jgi:hypothetical protein